MEHAIHCAMGVTGIVVEHVQPHHPSIRCKRVVEEICGQEPNVPDTECIPWKFVPTNCIKTSSRYHGNATSKCTSCGLEANAHFSLDESKWKNCSFRQAYVLVRNAKMLCIPVDKACGIVDTICSTSKKLNQLLSALLQVCMTESHLTAIKSNVNKAMTALAQILSRSNHSAKLENCLELHTSLDTCYAELFVITTKLGKKPPNPLEHLRSVCCNVLKSDESAAECRNNPLYEYLQLRQHEANLINLNAIIATTSRNACDGPSEGTMRGRDPRVSDSVRAWWSSCRDRVAAWSAFACPNAAAIAAIKEFCRSDVVVADADVTGGAVKHAKPSTVGVLEVGAGLGYWAMMLRVAKVSVIAVDKCPAPTEHNLLNKLSHHQQPSTSKSRDDQHHQPAKKMKSNNRKRVPLNEYHGHFGAWSQVKAGGADTAAAHPDRVLLLCYPPPDCAMALETLNSFSGNRLAYVGEFHGDTGTAEFERQLLCSWGLVGSVPLPNFGNTVYALTLWHRKGVAQTAAVLRLSVSLRPPVLVPSALSSSSSLSSSLLTCACCKQELHLFKKASTSSSSQNSQVVYRDRLTRCVLVCSAQCAASAVTDEARVHEASLRHLSGYCAPDLAFDKTWTRVQ